MTSETKHNVFDVWCMCISIPTYVKNGPLIDRIETTVYNRVFEIKYFMKSFWFNICLAILKQYKIYGFS